MQDLVPVIWFLKLMFVVFAAGAILSIGVSAIYDIINWFYTKK